MNAQKKFAIQNLKAELPHMEDRNLLVAAAANPLCKTRVWKLTNVRLVVSLEES